MSKYIVSARKYRPTRFDEVVGQKHVSKTLKNALKTNHLGHSFLFCGPRGVGKTTTARILAKVLNCQNRTEDYEPCNSCESCEAFNSNSSFNIFELDAASNNGVEHIRELVDQVRFPPQQGDYKVYIIDEVHMLSQQAFNAFLKTLEEPPGYAIFILATTEKHKILPTILSRCQIFDFNRVQIADMVKHLQFICGEEGIEAEESALHTIALKADGALRDSLSIFDRIVSYSGKKITYDTVTESLNILDYDTFFEFTNALLIQDKNQVLTLFNDVLSRGFDGDQVILGLAEHFRNLLVAKDPQTIELLEVTSSLKDRYIDQSALCKISFLLNALHISNACDVSFRQAKNKRLHVELALLKICYLGSRIKSQEIAENVKSVKKNTENSNLKKELAKPKEETTASVISKEKKAEEPEELIENEIEEVDTEEIHPVEKEQNQKSNLPEKEEKIETDEKQIVQLEKKRPKSYNTFQLSSLGDEIKKQPDIEEMQSKAEEPKEDIENDNEVDVDIEEIQSAFKQLEKIFAEKGLPTLETAISQSSIKFEKKTLTIEVIGEIAKQLVMDNLHLIIDYIKQETPLQRFYVNIEAKEVDIHVPKTYTKQEQLEYIKKQNPAVQKLCDEFDLEIDYNS